MIHLFSHRTFLCLYLLMQLSGCNDTNNLQDTNTVSTAKSEPILQVNVASGCFNRYERCADGSCLYGYDPCLCPASSCPTNLQMPPMYWGADNSSSNSITITRIRVSFINLSGSVLQTNECNLNPFTLGSQESIPLPLPSCSVPTEGPAGIDYKPSSFDLRSSSLKFTVFYLGKDGKEKESSITKPMQVLKEN